MSEKQYSTGEIAKLCDVTVRTVQYYDKRGILTPSSLSEGGRRLYTDTDVERLRLLCFLRGLGLSIDNISKIFAEENAGKVIDTILEEHIRTLKQEIQMQTKQLKDAEALTAELKTRSRVTAESMKDIAHIMKTRKELRKIHLTIIVFGLLLDAIEAGTFIYAVTTGKWLWFALGMVVVMIGAIPLFHLYCTKTAFICPECHNIFQAGKREIFFAQHTPKTRRLTCPNCKKKMVCIETVYDTVNI